MPSRFSDRLREEQRRRPSRRASLEAFPEMQSGGIARPKFDGVRNDSIARPERRTRNFLAGEFFGELRNARLEIGRVLDRLALD